MRLQPKSVISALSTGRARGQRSGSTAEPASSPHLQSLAAELHQSALQGLFEYPSNWVMIAKATAATLTALTLFHVAMVVIPAVQAGSTIIEAMVSWNAAGSILGALIAMLVSAFVANLLAPIQVTPEGLGVSELTGWRRIPWGQIGVLRIMELPAKGRYVVMVPFKGRTRPPTPAPMLSLIPGLAGALRSGECGVLLTSDVNNFERLLQLVVSYMAQAKGQNAPAVEAFVDENAIFPMAQLALEPDAAMTRLGTRPATSDADPYGLSVSDAGPDIRWRKLIPPQLLISVAPAVLLLVDVLLRNDGRPPSLWHIFWAVAIMAAGVAELPFAGMLTQSVGEMLVGGGQFRRAVLAYLELQVPRAALIVVGTALLAIGLPAPTALVCWLAGLGLTSVLATRFAQRLYFVPLSQALLVGLGCFAFQISLFALYFGVR